MGLNDLKHIHREGEEGRSRQGYLWWVPSPAWIDFAPQRGLCFQHNTEQRFVNYHTKNKAVAPKIHSGKQKTSTSTVAALDV